MEGKEEGKKALRSQVTSALTTWGKPLLPPKSPEHFWRMEHTYRAGLSVDHVKGAKTHTPYTAGH